LINFKKNFFSISFNRNELCGAPADLGTDLPLLIALLNLTDLHPFNVFLSFGLCQIFTGFFYKIPMPIQPLKVMASLVITQNLNSTILLSAGFIIGILILIFSLTGLLTKLDTYVSIELIRGLQFGLGLSLITLSVKNYISLNGWNGYIFACTILIILLLFNKNKKIPFSLVALGLGSVVSLFLNFTQPLLSKSKTVYCSFISTDFLDFDILLKGLFLLTIPQLPLSLANSIYSTKQLANQLFKNNKISLTHLATTYSLMNIISPFFGGIPVCHGVSGLIGHYLLGARTGGSVIIYGIFYVLLAFLLKENYNYVLKFLSLPLLGSLLLYEGLGLLCLVKNCIMFEKKKFIFTIFIGFSSFLLPYGFALSFFIGIVLYRVIFKPTKVN